MNPAEEKLASLTREDLLAEAEKVRVRLQTLDYKGCIWDANIVQKLMEVAIASDIELPFRPRLARDVETAEGRLEMAQSEYLKRWGWTMTCQTPGSYWMWHRDWASDDQTAVNRWYEREEQRTAELKEHGRPLSPNSCNPPSGYGIVCVPKDIALSMTLRVLDERPEDGEGED